MFGLGNIGDAYKDTRHNIGFWIVERLAAHFGSGWKKEDFTCITSSFQIEDEKILFVKPTTYMNLSGRAAEYIVTKYAIDLSDFILISDDLNLPIGKIRFRLKGSSGGHNGIKSIISYLGTNEFPRLRVGIGNPEQNGLVVDFVLGHYTEEEKESINKVIEVVQEAIIYALQNGIAGSMNKYNGMNIIE